MIGSYPMQSCPCHSGAMNGAQGGQFPGVNGTGQLNGQGMGMDSSMLGTMSQMMSMMMQLLQQLSGGQGNLPSQAGFGPASVAGNSGGLNSFLGGGAASPSASGGSPASSVAAGSDAPAAGNAQAASPVQIGPGTKVLEIGDSHSVGTFGQELDAKLRGTGAQVSTYASAGANPSDFVNGTGHKYGYWEKKADGSEKKVGYGTNAAPPKLDSLIAQEKPNVILVNLGANFRGGNPKAEVDKIGQIAKKHNIPIVWVGPPKTREDNSNSSSIQSFDQKMAEAVAPYGKYIPSSNLTPKYSGGDGIHYSGNEGNSIAKQWATGVFGALTGR